MRRSVVIGPSAQALGIIGCGVCGQLNRCAIPAEHYCSRCGASLHARKTRSIARTTALTLAAALLYIPANLYPVLETETLSGTEGHTILAGIVELWQDGSWLLATLVFFASIFVPLLKLTALGLLLFSVCSRRPWHVREQTGVYRLIEFVGRWSMLDVYVVSILVALVHWRTLETVHPGTGSLAFAAVVVLTMLATRAFDPRLLWDVARESRA